MGYRHLRRKQTLYIIGVLFIGLTVYLAAWEETVNLTSLYTAFLVGFVIVWSLYRDLVQPEESGNPKQATVALLTLSVVGYTTLFALTSNWMSLAFAVAFAIFGGMFYRLDTAKSVTLSE